MMMLGEEAIFGRAVLHFRRQTPQQQSPTKGDPKNLHEYKIKLRD